MKFLSSKRFDKQLAKFSVKTKKKCIERIELFVKNPHHESLNNHSLSGKYNNCRSINITGDLRAVYEVVEEDIVYFVAIGSHSELYS